MQSGFTVCFVPALGRTILRVRPPGIERLAAMSARSHRILFVSHFEGEQKPYRQHQRMEIPHNHWMVVQFQMVGGRISLEAGQSPSVQIQRVLIQPISFPVIYIRAQESKCPVSEYLLQPLKGFAVAAHERHRHRLRLIVEGKEHCCLCPVVA